MRTTLLSLAALLLFIGTAWADPLTLKECLNRAATQNQALRATSHDTAIAQQQVEIARSAWRPRIDLQAGYQAQQAAQAVQLGPIVEETQQADFPFLNLTLNSTLYDFGRTEARVSAARMQREAARHSYSGSEQDLFLQVVRAYYGILEAHKVVQAAEDEVVQMTSHQKTAQALYDQGVVTRNDLLQAEVRVAASRQKLLSAQNAVENGWLLLNYLTGTPPQQRAELQEDPLPLLAPTVEAPTDISRRGEILALRSAVSASDYAVQEAKTNYYPEIFARLGLDYVQNDRVREQSIMYATVGVKVNLFDGLATTSRLRQAVEARSRDQERLRDLEARVALELAQAQNDVKVATARIKVAEKAIQQGIENLRITKDRYQEKVGTATEVVDAQTLLTQTRTDYYQSVFDLQVADARVRRAAGNL
ncbi:protein CyaE [Geomonas limicola]|uniref:Protein CyaE n=1 Tax=Geomonas limicola TaxID=2740186 RepID=A0A6V8N2V5_9BACT|nr:TolC family protein [Geomonas limicola]GFO66761.1 protein CyaE [Geomonas limicola]